MDWIRNIVDVVMTADKEAKCNWFSYAYVISAYILGLSTVVYVLMYVQHLPSLKLAFQVWRGIAVATLVLTAIFYITCQRSLPRKNVL